MTRGNFRAKLAILLLVVGFVASAAMVWLREKRVEDEEVPVLRIAHWGLEAAMREGFATILADYEAAKAAQGVRVRVEQLPVPARAYASWQRTQLVGGNAPDLLQIQPSYGMSDELAARFLRPLGNVVDEPNPWNEGTNLVGVRWRETIFDGLEVTGFNSTLNEYYAIPLNIHTTRLIYNVRLLREVTGQSSPPTTYREFIRLIETVEARSRSEPEPLVVIAGSRYNAPFLFNALFSGATQRLRQEMDTTGEISPRELPFHLALLEGRWSFDSPAVRQALALLRETAAAMPRGFMQLERNDATFHFLQERAIALVAGSWTAPSILAEAAFPLTVANFPYPTADDGEVGRGGLGAPAEVDGAGHGGFALTRDSRHPQLALDLLQYLSSQPVATRYAELTNSIPATLGSEVPEPIRAFEPTIEGHPPGIRLGFFGDHFRRSWLQNEHLLVEPRGSVDAFLAVVSPQVERALRQDGQRRADALVQSLRWQDAHAWGKWHAVPDGAEAERSFGQMLDAQTLSETDILLLRSYPAD